MSSRQLSRTDLGGIPEGDPIENKVCLSYCPFVDRFCFVCNVLFFKSFYPLFLAFVCFI